jgi:hypothetical protein
MRSAGNFHPEWGYLAPAPSFLRTARVVLVATAIGATAGAAVIIALVPRPSADASDTSLAAHALVTSVPVVTEVASPPASAVDESTIAQQPLSPPAPPIAAPPTRVVDAPASGVATKANTISAPPPKAPAGVAGLPESSLAVAAPTEAGAPSASATDETVGEPDSAPAKLTKKHHTADYDTSHRGKTAGRRWRNGRTFDPLFRLFSARGGQRDSF